MLDGEKGNSTSSIEISVYHENRLSYLDGILAQRGVFLNRLLDGGGVGDFEEGEADDAWHGGWDV